LCELIYLPTSTTSNNTRIPKIRIYLT